MTFYTSDMLTHGHSKHGSRLRVWAGDTQSTLQHRPSHLHWRSSGSSCHWSWHRQAGWRCLRGVEGGCRWARWERGCRSDSQRCRRWAWRPRPCQWSGTILQTRGCHTGARRMTGWRGSPCSSRVHSGWCRQSRGPGLRQTWTRLSCMRLEKKMI